MIWHVPGLPLLLDQRFAACLLGLVELYMFKWHKHIYYMNMSIRSIITEQALVVAREKGILNLDTMHSSYLSKKLVIFALAFATASTFFFFEPPFPLTSPSGKLTHFCSCLGSG